MIPIWNLMGIIEIKPQVQALANVRDVNQYHTEPTVLDHTKAVKAALDDSLNFGFIQVPEVRARLRTYFFHNVGHYTKRDLLGACALLHDIGKACVTERGRPVMQTKFGGVTSCPNHAEVGAKAALEILNELGLEKPEVDYMTQVISNHMRPLRLYTGLSTANHPAVVFRKFQEAVGDVYLDVLVHARADRLGGTLNEECQFPVVTFREHTYFSDQPFIEDLITTAL